MAKLIVIQDGREKTFDLIDELVFVGSGEDCTIRVREDGVAEKHCQLLKVDGMWRLVDLSGGGTRVNGTAVAQRQLENGDVIQIGPLILNFRGNVQPVVTPDESDAASGVPRSSPKSRRTAGRARAKVARARRGREEDEPRVRVNPKLERAAGSREVITRKRLRKGGLTGAQAAALAGGVVLVLVVVFWKALSGLEQPGASRGPAPRNVVVFWKALSGLESQDVADHFERGMKFYAQGRLDEALAEFRMIPESAGSYPAARRKIEEIEANKEEDVALDRYQDGVKWYENQIRQFIIDKIDPETRKKKYVSTESSQIRYLVKRLEYFLEHFKGHKYYPAVEELYAKYKPLAPTGPPTYVDVDVEARHEQGLRNWGYAYSILAQWLQDNPGATDEEKTRARRLMDNLVNDAQVQLDYADKEARTRMQELKFGVAYGIYKKWAARFEGFPPDKMPRINGKTADELAEELKEKIDELGPS